MCALQKYVYCIAGKNMTVSCVTLILKFLSFRLWLAKYDDNLDRLPALESIYTWVSILAFFSLQHRTGVDLYMD